MGHLPDYSTAGDIWRETHDYESVLQHLRKKGFSQFESIKALRESCGVSLAEAKIIAKSSSVWSDIDAEIDRLHDSVEEGLGSDD